MRVYEILALSPDDLDAVRGMLKQAPFTDGKASAGALAQGKSNKQLDRVTCDPSLLQRLEACVFNALKTNQRLRAVQPMKMTAPRFARYEVGDQYPLHVDNPLMAGPGGTVIRTDMSMTIFLNNPEEYAGGELNLRVGNTSSNHKLPAGHAVIYPTGQPHCVFPVIGGVREVAVLWIQSRVADPVKRELLDEMGQLMEHLLANGHTLEAARADAIYGNLVRMWAET